MLDLVVVLLKKFFSVRLRLISSWFWAFNFVDSFVLLCISWLYQITSWHLSSCDSYQPCCLRNPTKKLSRKVSKKKRSRKTKPKKVQVSVSLAMVRCVMASNPGQSPRRGGFNHSLSQTWLFWVKTYQKAGRCKSQTAWTKSKTHLRWWSVNWISYDLQIFLPSRRNFSISPSSSTKLWSLCYANESSLESHTSTSKPPEFSTLSEVYQKKNAKRQLGWSPQFCGPAAPGKGGGKLVQKRETGGGEVTCPHWTHFWCGDGFLVCVGWWTPNCVLEEWRHFTMEPWENPAQMYHFCTFRRTGQRYPVQDIMGFH